MWQINITNFSFIIQYKNLKILKKAFESNAGFTQILAYNIQDFFQTFFAKTIFVILFSRLKFIK